MSKILCSLLAGLLICGAAAQLTASTRQRPASNLAKTRQAHYTIYQRIGGDTTETAIGTEKFTIKNFSDNTIIVDGESEMDYSVIGGPAEPLRSTSHLEMDEESLSPRKYSIVKAGRGVDQEIRLEMVTNVAVIDYRLNENWEQLRRILSGGTMILDPSILYQRWLLLERFSAGFTGRMNITVFNPILKREMPAKVDYLGEETVAVRDQNGTFKKYKISVQGAGEMDLYVDDSGMIVLADTGAQQIVLTEFSEDTAPPGDD